MQFKMKWIEIYDFFWIASAIQKVGIECNRKGTTYMKEMKEIIKSHKWNLDMKEWALYVWRLDAISCFALHNAINFLLLLNNNFCFHIFTQ